MCLEVARRYSELLSQTTGPVLSPSKVVSEPLVQPAPPARVFERPHDLTLKLDNSAQAHFDLKSMEPKVQVPFVSRPGVVPRKVRSCARSEAKSYKYDNYGRNEAP